MTLDVPMTITLTALRWLALDPGAQARFWAEVLDLPIEGGAVAAPGVSLEFVGTDRPKTVQARIHLDLTSNAPEDQQDRAALARLVELGTTALDGGGFLDPDGNEFTVTSVVSSREAGPR
jgi:hypothetical protein